MALIKHSNVEFIGVLQDSVLNDEDTRKSMEKAAEDLKKAEQKAASKVKEKK